MTSPANTDPVQYSAEGYCLFRGVLSPEEIVIARNHLDSMLSRMLDRQVVYKDGAHKEVDARPEYLSEPHPRHACWLEPRIA